jgi:hypothetical protein
MPMSGRRRLLGLAVAGASMLALAPGAFAGIADENALAQKYAPVVRLVERSAACGPGEPYKPLDVNLLFNEPTVALRGPWNSTDLVKIAPTARDLANRFEYHLDFPGDPLDPGCDYERWAAHITGDAKPVVYAHVATDPSYPGKLALQYWFFYVFNDFNNTHEGDWEMIQLNFEAASAAAALDTDPYEAGYSSHEGAERATWGGDKIEIVDGTHPVVYPASGSHANKFTAALYLGSSAEAGVGCDNTLGPHVELNPTIETLPSDPAVALAKFPWLAFQGRWGELQPAFFNGPTGPNLKTQWTEPFLWAHDWRDRSYAVPTGGLFGTRATDLFCIGVAVGSKGLIRLLRNPVPMLIALLLVIGLIVFVVVRTTWTPVAPLRIARRRTAGQVLSASARMYVKRPRLFIGLGTILVPIAFAITALQYVLFFVFDSLGAVTGDLAGGFAFFAVVIGATLALLGLGFLQAATACALVEIDAGRPVGPLGACRIATRRLRPLLRGSTLLVATWIVLTTTTFLIPVAVWLVVRWSLLAPVVELEDHSGIGALRRSGQLVRSQWLRVGTLVGLSAVVVLAAGPLIGVGLIFLTHAPLELLNVIAGVVYALSMPFVALVTAYTYFDARARLELEPIDRRDELPAEINLGVS